MGSMSIAHWLIVALYIAILVLPVAKILSKAGFSGWWSLLAIVPIVNLPLGICVCALAGGGHPTAKMISHAKAAPSFQCNTYVLH